MSKAVLDTLKNQKDRDCARIFPEFCVPTLENFQFLIADYGFGEPSLRRVSRECWITFKRSDSEIEIAYEPLTLPWGYLTKSRHGRGERLPLNDLMSQYDIHPNELNYREYDEAREKLFATRSAMEADQFARSSKEVFDQAVVERIRDMALFLKKHLKEILAES